MRLFPVFLSGLLATLVACFEGSDIAAPSKPGPLQPSATGKPTSHTIDYDNLNREKVVPFATAYARSRGYDMGLYLEPSVYKDGQVWRIHWEMRPPSPPGGGFSVGLDVARKTIAIDEGD